MKTVPAAIIAEPQSTVFDRWAKVYDTQSNPLLLLEERIAPSLLPTISGKHILDIGCGTGRWLQRLEALLPASLIGTDCSAAMLERAREKIMPATCLHQCDSSSTPGDEASHDLILASFLLSYVEDLQAFARECARVLKPGGHILISDMHPVTAIERSWTRSFHLEGTKVSIAAHSRSLAEIIATFNRSGFELNTLAEPSFAIQERAIFEKAGKLAEYTSLTGIPAIYLLKLQKRAALQLVNAPWSTSPATWSTDALSIQDARITAPEQATLKDTHRLDLSGYVLMPGLINAHDHLEFALFPNLGRTEPYQNSSEWAADIHQKHAATIALHQQVPLDTRLWWGAIRNLLCGVTTVCHHNPLHPALTHPDFPIRVVADIGWSHSLAFDHNLAETFQATPPHHPFILHAAEGIDRQSSEEFAALKGLGVLDDRTVLVHGLAFTSENITLLNQRRAALVLCPTSNRFLFSQAPSSALIALAERLALGSDSPLTSAGDLLDEIRYLHTQQAINPEILFKLVTTNPAEILHLQQGEGTIAQGFPADLIAVRDARTNPAETLARLTIADVELVMISGRVQVASPEIYGRIQETQREGLHLLEIAGQDRWVRAPLPTLFNAAERVLGKDNLRIGNKEVRHLPPL
jgi:cytosine/adenosine deaminase-related metal-dependent hydrolase/ubiquinone/menaquinone biosynthesis C-methylase UbiE